MKIKKDLTLMALLAMIGVPVFGATANAHAATYHGDNNVTYVPDGSGKYGPVYKNGAAIETVGPHGIGSGISKSEAEALNNGEHVNDPRIYWTPNQNTNGNSQQNSQQKQYGYTGYNSQQTNNNALNANNQSNNSVQYSSRNVLPQTGEVNNKAKSIALAIILAGASAASFAASKKLDHEHDAVKETSAVSGNDPLDNILEGMYHNINKLNKLIK